jgi:hypothetical protein
MVNAVEQERLVGSQSRRAKVTRVALLASALGAMIVCGMSVVFLINPIPAAGMEHMGLLMALGALAYALGMALWFGAMLVSAIAFLLWLHRAYVAAAALNAAPTTETAGGAVLSFFIPILNLVRPYRAVAALLQNLDPAGMPEPTVTPHQAPEVGVGYRDNAGHIHVAIPTPPAPITAWWSLWLLQNVALRFTGTTREGHEFDADACWAWLVGGAVSAVAAVLCARVVHAVDARVRERHRRIQLAAR